MKSPHEPSLAVHAEALRKKQADQIRQDLGDQTRKSKAGDPKLMKDQRLMALTVPVLEALVAADAEHPDHRYHGSLGWALKDKAGTVASDRQTWLRARDELTTAISVRDDQGDPGWRLYEANRAVCSIQLYNELADGDPEKAKLAAAIEHDLQVASAQPMVESASRTIDPDIADWRNRQAVGP